MQISHLLAELREVIKRTMIFYLNEPKGQGKLTVKLQWAQTVQKGLAFGGGGGKKHQIYNPIPLFLKTVARNY